MTDPAPTQISVHALQIGDRINTAGFEGEVVSSTPLAVRIGASGLAVVFRYGVVVFLGARRKRVAGQNALTEDEAKALEELDR